MSPKRQVNHNIRKHFNTIIYNISRYAEIALSMVILLVIALAGFRLIMEVADMQILLERYAYSEIVGTFILI